MKDIMNAPELEMLKGNVKGTPEGEKSVGMEFKRTKLSIDLLNWVINGNYEDFTVCQNENVRLSQKSFDEIQEYTRRVLKTDDDIYAMQAYLVINDLGKVVYYINQIEKEFNLKSVDHDELLYEGLKRKPSLSPTFSSLSAKYKEIILNGLKTKFNMGQYVQSENLPASLIPLKKADKISLDFYMIHVFYDIAGAAGHVQNNGSIIITESYWQNFKAANDTIFDMISNNLRPQDAYKMYLRKRAHMLNISSDSLEDLAIVKICNLLRVSNSEDARKVALSYLKQPIQVKEMLSKELAKDGITSKGIVLYYSPATLSNAISFFKKRDDKDAISKAMNIVLPIFANVYGYARAKMIKDNNLSWVCTVFIADVAEKAKNPIELENYDLSFEKVNNDYTVNCELKEKINIRVAKKFEICGDNILMVAMGGGSDCIQASMIGKYLLKGRCSNVVSIRMGKTGSQNEQGEMNKERVIYNPKEIIAKDVYLCGEKTDAEGRFFENLPSEIDINLYLIIVTEKSRLDMQIQDVINHISEKTGKRIDTIVGVDTGGDCLYPMKVGTIAPESTPDQDRLVMETLNSYEKYGINIFNCIVSPGIDSPNGITSNILTKANAAAYIPSIGEKRQILETYSKWKMDGTVQKRFGKTSLTWQAALKGERGLITLNIPINMVLSENNPWIPTVTVRDFSETVVFMKTSDCINAINMFE